MADYEIEWAVPYEGIQKISVMTLDEVVAWVRGNAAGYGWDLDNVDIRGHEGEVDPYDLMARADAGRPLAPAGVADVASAVFWIMHDVRQEKVGPETLGRLDTLRGLLQGLARENDAGTPGGMAP